MTSTATRGASIRLVVAATLLLAVSHFDRQVFAFVAPTLTRQLGIDDAQYGLLAGFFSVAYVIAPPLGAFLLDRYGLRRGLFAAVCLWSLVSALHGVASGFVAFAVARFALGLAEAPSAPGATRLIERAVPRDRRSRAIGFMLIGSSIGAVLAPIVSTWFSSRFGWRVAFAGTALVGLVWLPLFAWASRGQDLDAATRVPSRDRDSFRRALADDAVRRALLGVMACSPVAALGLLWGAKLLVSRYGVGEGDVGKYLFLPPIFYDVAAIASGDLLSRFSSRRAERALFGVATVFSTALVAMAVMDATPRAVTALACIAMSGVAGVVTINTSVLVAQAPKELVTMAVGLVTSMQALVFALSSAVVGRVVLKSGVTLGFDGVVFAFALWSVMVGALWIFGFRARVLQPEASAAPHPVTAPDVQRISQQE